MARGINMKALLVNTSDIRGGAAKAAYRLHQGLQREGIASQFLAQNKASSDPTVMAPKTTVAKSVSSSRVAFDALPLKLYKARQTQKVFSLQWLPERNASRIKALDPDIVNLHWTGDAFLRIETLAKLKRPLVLTLHDMWAFTGGCHYSGECDRYTTSCGQCPQLGSSNSTDLSRWVWQRKAKSWKDLDITVVALSSWLAKCAKSSSLFQEVRTEIIPNGLDTELYRPIDKTTARSLLGLPSDKKLILFASINATSDERKGFHLLKSALEQLGQSQWRETIELVVLGARKPSKPPELGFCIHYLDTLNDDLSMAVAYSAADVFVLPSIQENLSNTILEASACGTPCVAFNIGGMPDMISPMINGYLAKPYEVDDLAKGLIWIIENEERAEKLSFNARERIEQDYTMAIQAKRYTSLFEELMLSS